MLGFSEKEIGHFTLKKWLLLYKQYQKYHNFKMKQGFFKEQTEYSEEWLPD